MNSESTDTSDARNSYISALNRLIDQAITYMGEDRALQIAHSTPVRIDSSGNIEEYKGSQTQESQRAVAQFVLHAYVEVMGQQLVMNMLEAAVTGDMLQDLKGLCRSQAGQSMGGGAVA